MKLLAALLLTAPAFAGHPWGGADLCEVRRDVVPPGINAALLPEPASVGAALLQRHCTQCHELPGPGRHTRDEWPDVLARMDMLMRVSHFYRGPLGPVAMPTPEERAALRAYLERHALRALPKAMPVGAAAERHYREVCGDCHAAPDPHHYATDAAGWSDLLMRMDRHRVSMARPPLSMSQRTAVDVFMRQATIGPLPFGGGHDGIVLPVHEFAVEGRGFPPSPFGRRWPEGPDEGRDRALPEAAPSAGSLGRWASLGAFFGLALLGLWRWSRRAGR